MLSSDDFVTHRDKLVDPKISDEKRRVYVAEIRDSLEVVYSQESVRFLDVFLPAFKVVLTQLTKPQQTDNVIHRTRSIILEILNRLPHNGIPRNQKLHDIFSLAMEVLRTDNEDNAQIAFSNIFELHKNFKNDLQSQVQPFLDFVRQIYENFSKTVDARLLSKNNAFATNIQSTSTRTGPSAQAPKPPRFIALSSQSFKIITECPLLVIVVFQLHPGVIEKNIHSLLPFLVRAIQYEIPTQKVSSVPKGPFNEFIAAQVKTLSFRAHLLKHHPERLIPEEETLPRSVVNLMQICPGGAVHIRKDLLMATKHILTSSFRRGFFEQLDLLLDETVLVGTGKTTTDTLRPLAYSFLADLVHGVRPKLSIPQLEKIVYLFSTNVHDPIFSYTNQNGSVRLLLNLLESIQKIASEDSSQRKSARELLVRILETMISKYISLGDQVADLLKTVQDLREEDTALESGKKARELPMGNPLKDITEFKHLLSTLTLGLKTVIWSIITEARHPTSSRANQQGALPSNHPDQNPVVPPNCAENARTTARTGLLEQESEMVAQLLTAGRKCTRLYARHEKANGGPGYVSFGPGRTRERKSEKKGTRDLLSDLSQNFEPSNIIIATKTEEEDVFEQFARIFTVLDVRGFQDIFGSRIGDLFEFILENPAASNVPHHFLANDNVSKYFADILLNFLIQNMKDLDRMSLHRSGSDQDRKNRAAALLRLFKIVFASLGLFSGNEPVLKLHLATIVRNSLRFASASRNPILYLEMLKALFKSISCEKRQNQFDLLYGSFVPLVEPVYSTLLALYDSPCGSMHKDLIIELCLLVPARASTVFPHLDKQIKPILWAIESESLVATYGLRTLEFWIDMLQPSYLDSFLSSLEPALTKALHKHLKPPRNQLATEALRIIGKLGSRSRYVNSKTVPFAFESFIFDAQIVKLRWPGGTVIDLPTDKIIKLTVDALLGRRQIESDKHKFNYERKAWRFLFTCLSSFLERGSDSTGSSSNAGNQNGSLWSLVGLPHSSSVRRSSHSDFRRKTRTARLAETDLVKRLLLGLIVSSSGLSEEGSGNNVSDKGTEADKSLFSEAKGLCSYFALLTVQESNRTLFYDGRLSQSWDEKSGQPMFISHTLFVDVLVDAISQECQKHTEAGLLWMKFYVAEVIKYCATLKGSTNQPRSGMQSSKESVQVENDGTSVPMKSASVSPEEAAKSKSGPVAGQSKSNEDPMDVCPADSNKTGITEKVNKAGKGDSEGSQKSREGKSPSKTRRMSQISSLVASLGHLIECLAHCCYKRTWRFRSTGTKGFEVLLESLPRDVLRSPVFVQYYMLTFRALVFMTRDSPEPSANLIVSSGRKILNDSFQYFFPQRDKTYETGLRLSRMHESCLKEVTKVLLLELISASPSARETARSCLVALGTALKIGVADLIIPLKEHLIRPLQQRPLRQHPISLQIGFLEATNFCLELGKPVLSTELFSAPTRDYVVFQSVLLLDGSTPDPAPETEEAFKNVFHEVKYYQAETVRQLLYLRRQVLKLLRNITFYCSEYLMAPSNENLYNSTITYFFANMQSRDEQIVKVATEGLQRAVEHHKHPKELISYNLRPFLGNLNDFKLISMPSLEGLARILKLFSKWFNLSLGERLLEHLRKRTDPEKFAAMQKRATGVEARIAPAILELFHLLPPSASQFLPRVVDTVIRLESFLSLAPAGAAHLGLKSDVSASTSPYRVPLLKFCNCHPVIASKLFLSHLDDYKMRQLFFVMLRSKESVELRKDLMDNPKKVLQPPYFSLEAGGGPALYIISLFNILSRHDPSWLGSDKSIMLNLTEYWKMASLSSELSQHGPSSRVRVEEIKILAEMFIRYCKTFEKEVDLLFELLGVFSLRTTCDFAFVKRYLHETVSGVRPNPNTNAIMDRFLWTFQNKSTTQERKFHILRHIVIPLITRHLKAKERTSKGTNISVDGKVTQRGNVEVQKHDESVPRSSASTVGIQRAVAQSKELKQGAGIAGNQTSRKIARDSLTSPSINGKASPVEGNKREIMIEPIFFRRIVEELLRQPYDLLRTYDDVLVAEMLRLASLLVQHMAPELGGYRKELINFGWNYLKAENSTVRHHAFINVSSFFAAYKAPDSLMLPVYVVLLGECRFENRHLVQEALDILTPVLPRRVKHNPEHRFPIWIRYTKKILVEKGHKIQNLVHIWQLICRHPQLFFLSRAQFVPSMVHSLGKISLYHTATPENRRLALDLVNLIITWEESRRRIQGIYRSNQEKSDGVTSDRKRPRGHGYEAGEVSDGALPSDQPSGFGPPSKLQKANDGQALATMKQANNSNIPAPIQPDDFKPNGAMVDMLVSILVQMPVRPIDRRETFLITKRCLALLEKILKLWPQALVRLNPLERLFAPVPADKPSANITAASAGSRAQNPPASDNMVVDSKGGKPPPPKRSTVRTNALITSLLVSSVAIKLQGRLFVKNNLKAIRSLAQPSITENSISTSSQFSSLLPVILEGYKSSSSTSVMMKQTGKAACDQPGKATGTIIKHAETSSETSDQTWVSTFVQELHRALDLCMRSSDYGRNYCGLVVLKVLRTVLPQEFLRYQDTLTKSLHRMTKEFVSSVHGSGSNGFSSSLQRSQQTGTRGQASAEKAASGQPRSNSTTKNLTGKGLEHVGDGHRMTKNRSIDKDFQSGSQEAETLRLCLSLVEHCICTLETSPRKQLISSLISLIEKCAITDVLLELVKLVHNLVFWSTNSRSRAHPSIREPLTTKDKIQLLSRMVAFEKIRDPASQGVIDVYLTIILQMFGTIDSSHRRTDVLSKLERGFMIGLKSYGSPLRQKFFDIFDSSVGASAFFRLQYIISTQEWKYLADTFWIKNAVELLISSVEKSSVLELVNEPTGFQRLSVFSEDGRTSKINTQDNRKERKDSILLETTGGVAEPRIDKLKESVRDKNIGDFISALIDISNSDAEIACQLWILLLPRIWSQLAPVEQSNLERSLSSLLNKEYHQTQISWQQNCLQTLLISITKLRPLPSLPSSTVRYIGSRWNAWHTALDYFERREDELKQRLHGETVSEKVRLQIAAELEDIGNSQVSLFIALQESDYLAGTWKTRSENQRTLKALSFEQIGLFADAQDVYSDVLEEHISASSESTTLSMYGNNEALFWEERWIECAKNLCQWEVLTEFSRTVVSPNLLHECLWRIPDWGALKELLEKKPAPDVSKMKIYESYIQLQENKLENAEAFIAEGFKRTQERFAALPETADLDAMHSILVQFQKLVELQESASILSELNALSRNGSSSINVDQKIDNVRIILNTWRERLPSPHEPLWVWNDLLSWRNHVHAVVVNVLEALKETANAKIDSNQVSVTANAPPSRGASHHAQKAQVEAAKAIAHALPQHVLVMGVNETAWNVHRFAKACRKQGFPDVALYILQKLYPFGTMELTEYFVKTKETARAYMARPRGLEKHVESGLNELSRCNMDHFNARQKAQLFSLKGKLYSTLGRDGDAVESISTALYTSADVGSAWLSWGEHCDNMQKKAAEDPSAFSDFAENFDFNGKQIEEPMGTSSGYAAELSFRESAVKCYLQAVRFGSRRARAFLPRVLRLLSLDVQSRFSFDFTTRHLIEHQSPLPQSLLASETGHRGSGTSAAKITQKDVKMSSISGKDCENEGRAKIGTSPIDADASKTDRLSSERKGVSRALSTVVLDIPPWMWLPWLTQLVQMLGRTEGLTVIPILSHISRQFPQALFFPLKAYMEDRIQLDKPKRHFFRETLKLWRPIAQPLRTIATPAHLRTISARVIQNKETVNRVKVQCFELRKKFEEMEKITLTSTNQSEVAQAVAGKERAKEDLGNTRKLLESSMREYRTTLHRQRLIQESIPGGQGHQPSAAVSQSLNVGDKSMKSDSGFAIGNQHKSVGSLGVHPSSNDHQQSKTSLGDLSVSKAVETPNLSIRVPVPSSVHPAVPSPVHPSVPSSVPSERVNQEQSKTGRAVTPYVLADHVMAQLVKYHQIVYLELDSIVSDISYQIKIQRVELFLGLMNTLLLRCYQSGTKSWEEIKPSIRTALEEVSRTYFGIGLPGNEQSKDQRYPSGLADLRDAFAAELSPQTTKDFPSDVETFIQRLRRWQGIFQRRVDALPDLQKMEILSKRLLDINGSDIEMFGQYSVVDVTEQCTEKHVTIQKFSADIRVIRRASSCCRGVTILGSDGKWYNFLVEQYITLNVQMAESRAAQVYRTMNECIFAKDAVAYRKRLHLAVPIYISTGARSRLVYTDEHLCSLSEGLEAHLGKNGESCDGLIMEFREAESEAKHRKRYEKDEGLTVQEVFAARVEAYEQICELRMSDTVWRNWIRSRMTTASRYFCFVKRFGETLGCGSATCYCLGIGSRRAQNLMFCLSTGAVHHGNTRVLSGTHGIMENDEAVPFRLTRNIRRALGGSGMQGGFFASMCGTFVTLMKEMGMVEMLLECVMRDEAVVWVSGKREGGMAAGRNLMNEKMKMDEFEKVEECIQRSMGAVKKRLSGQEVISSVKKYEGMSDAEKGIVLSNTLISKASSVENLAKMECSFQAWY